MFTWYYIRGRKEKQEKSEGENVKIWDEMLVHIKEWVIEAGKEQVKRLEEPVAMKSKTSAIDLVTEVDEWTDSFFVDKIKMYYPNHKILTEETGAHTGEENYEWVIDPIDGTVNYAHHFPLFCISVAVKYKGETVIGVVYMPKLNEMYEAIKGKGAKLNGEKIAVSKTNELNRAVLATGFPYDKATDPENNVGNFTKLITKIGGIRRTGSAAIDLCQVACGRFDAYWELKMNEWDIAAGLLIVEEAGGKTLTLKMKKGYKVLAGNPQIFPLVQKELHWNAEGDEHE